MASASKGPSPPPDILNWTRQDVRTWLDQVKLSSYGPLFDTQAITGPALLLMTEHDLRTPPLTLAKLGDIKILYNEIRKVQLQNLPALVQMGYDPAQVVSALPSGCRHDATGAAQVQLAQGAPVAQCLCPSGNQDQYPLGMDIEDKSEDGRASRLKPDLWKTIISMVYLFIVTWITAFVMVIVHNRVPDMKKYPPLPDIFLDNVPHIPWAFAMCEFTGTLMLLIWVAVLFFHKHRFILLRRFFALSGTVFLLRCVTMLITSLSVPGTHLQCNPMMLELELDNVDNGTTYRSVWANARSAYFIWRGAGMSIQGVRTCGDYMFSGHTAALTMLNFFITEYTPRHLYFMHTFSWILNMFGIFFILSAHEHYSIDVFIAFYITSRLFLYYHTLANNQALMQRDSTRTRIWFPLFSFFEAEIDGIVPNEFETPSSMLREVLEWAKANLSYCYQVSMRRSMPGRSNASRSPIGAGSSSPTTNETHRRHGASHGKNRQKES